MNSLNPLQSLSCSANVVAAFYAESCIDRPKIPYWVNTAWNWKSIRALITGFGLVSLFISPDVLATPQYPGDSFKQISPTAVSRDYVSLIQAGSRLVRISWRGDVEISEDQGGSWLNRSPGLLIPLSDIAWTGSRLVAVGSSGRIIGSDDLGLSWRNLPSNASSDYYSIAWTGLHLLASGLNGMTSQSADGGNTWETYYFQDTGQLYGAVGITNAWALVGSNGLILGSTDLGVTWYTLRTAVAGAPTLNDILFTGTVFIAVGDNGTILRGTRPDAMVPVSSGTTVKLTNLSRSGTRVFACGGQEQGLSTEPQTILSSDDGGLTWISRFTGSVGRVAGVAGTAPNLVAVGNPELVARSSTGGTTWVAEVKALTAPSTDDFSAMIEENGIIVGVGYGGKINTSFDGGRTWTSRNSQTTGYLYDILKAGNRLIAVGEAGIVRTSDDSGVTWSSRSLAVTSDFIGLASTGSTVVIVGANSAGTAAVAYYSIDQGNTWTPASVPTGGFLFAVAWTGSALVAVGYNGEAMRSSDEGRSWTKLATGTTSFFTEVAAGPGYLLASDSNGYIYRSANNGTTWNQIAGATARLGSYQNFHFDGSTWFAIGFRGIISSHDQGLTWNEYPHYVTQNSSRLVHDGSSLLLVNTSLKEVYSSKDGGESWTGLNVATIRHIYGITKKDDRYVAVGGVGQIMTSDNNGTSWKIWSAQSIYSNLNDVEPTPSGFVVAGSGGQLLTSTNGQQWELRSLPGVTADLNGVAYGAGRVVVVGGGGSAFVSTNDGSSWAAYPTGASGSLLGVAYGNGQFVAVGESGVILTSPNGVDWTLRVSGTSKMLWEATWTGTRYVAIGGTAPDSSGGGIILTSENGVSWTTRASELVDPPQSIAVIGSRLVVLGKTLRGISTNGGLNWTIDYGSLNWFYTAHWDGRILLAGGANKNLWYSEGNAEGLATLGLVPSVEVRGPGGVLLTKGVSTISRPSILIGEKGDPVTLTIRNTGTAPLTSLTVIPSGAAAADFVIDITVMRLSLDPGQITSFSLRFSPSLAGVRNASLRIGSNDPDDNPFILNLSGTGFTANEVFGTVIGNSNLTGNNQLPGATPYGDGVSNLLKYAFNLNLSGPDSHVMVSMGVSGLPLFRLVEIQGMKYWQVEYVRRRSSGLSYVPEHSTNLTPASFVPMSGTPIITAIDSNWERVTLSEIYDPAVNPRQFSRIVVTLP